MTGGSCLCGAVRFRVEGPLAAPIACHCVQCRKRSGHFTAATSAARGDVTVDGEVRWYEYKPGVRNGFCPACGAQLFWSVDGSHEIAIEMGAFDGDMGLRLAGHVFAGEKGDYYDIGDGLPAASGDRDVFP